MSEKHNCARSLQLNSSAERKDDEELLKLVSSGAKNIIHKLLIGAQSTKAIKKRYKYRSSEWWNYNFYICYLRRLR